MPMMNIGKLDRTRFLQFSDEQLAEKHFAICGRIGQRKTLCLVSILQQYIKLPGHAVIWIDLGGDQAAHWILRNAAYDAGKPFYLFSLGAHDCASWDPLLNTPAFSEDLTVAANGLAQGLRLEMGEGYGRTFWSRLSGAELNQAFDNLRAAGIELPSFEQLTLELRRLAETSRSRQHVSEAYLAADQILRYQALRERRTQELYLGRAIEESAVVVFYLPTAHHGGAARAVGSLAGWCTSVDAAYRYEHGLDKRTIHLAIDEFPQIASGRSAMSSALTLARKWGIQMYLVYQDGGQLNTADGDLTSIIRSQCQQILFTLESEEEQNALRYESKDVLRTLNSTSLNPLAATKQVREFWEPGLTRNEILDVSGVAMKAFGVFKLGDKHRDPIPFTVIPPTSKQEHEKLKRKPLPTLPADKPVADTPTPAPPARTKQDTGQAKRVAGLVALVAKIQAEEAWTMGS